MIRAFILSLSLLFVTMPVRADVLSMFMSLFGVQKSKVASLKVVTSQVAVATSAMINADLALAQAAMSSRALLDTTIEQSEISRSFGSVTGQGAQTCDAVSQRDDVDRISRTRDTVAFTAMVNAGRAGVARDAYESRRAVARLDAYCSADEHNLGLCRSRFDGMSSSSTSYSKLNLADQFTAKQLKAAEDFIAELVPPPVPSRRNDECGTGCQAERLRGLRVDAMASMVAVPMAAQLSGKIGEKTFALKR